MPIEKTLVIIKPDGVRKKTIRAIFERYTTAGLKIVSFRRGRMSEEMAEAFYAEHRGRPFFDGLVLAMTSGQCIYLTLEGDNAVARVRDVNGATNPKEAKPGTIRHDFPSAGGPFNMVHGSDSLASATREIALVFGT